MIPLLFRINISGLFRIRQRGILSWGFLGCGRAFWYKLRWGLCKLIISKLDNYYVFSLQNAEDLLVGVREDVSEDKNKRNKSDFVLWFTKSKFDDQELKWESPWGVGYPGWHIECSCISMKHLGEYLDIHCGGVDNIFPHHTNEIAQTESCVGHEWCKYWFHVNHLVDQSGKMSKSENNFLTVSTLEEKGEV